MKDIVVIPFHDWRKIQKEGFRTRDAHFIETFANNFDRKIVVVNRPITPLEIFFAKKNVKIKGEKVLKEGLFSLIKVKQNLFVIDFVSLDIFSFFLKKHGWYFNKYADETYVRFIEKSLSFLNIKKYDLLSQNIFANQLTSVLRPEKKVFDAWDNFTKFNVYKKIQIQIQKAYRDYSLSCDFWITNSKENIQFFINEFSVRQIHLIKNGVDTGRFRAQDELYIMPKDMIGIPKPIIGFGGKITHLIDIDLVNSLLKNNTDKSFVFVGQILNKEIFNRIVKLDNFYYLGDKYYDDYPKYVYNFNVCIIPYIVDPDKQSGANTIKVYEFLSMNKRVIGTRGNGIEDLGDFVCIADDEVAFTQYLKEGMQNDKKLIDINQISWNSKVIELVALYKNC